MCVGGKIYVCVANVTMTINEKAWPSWDGRFEFSFALAAFSSFKSSFEYLGGNVSEDSEKERAFFGKILGKVDLGLVGFWVFYLIGCGILGFRIFWRKRQWRQRENNIFFCKVLGWVLDIFIVFGVWGLGFSYI